jgi:nicotinamidase-related amidase
MTAPKTALLIIDIQQGILAIPDLVRRKQIDQALSEMVARIAGLIERARAADVPVIYVQHDGRRGHRLEPETPGWRFRPEIAPRPRELVIHKCASDAFFETRLQSELATVGANKLVVCGCMTQYCVDTTVRRAVSLGYDVILVADGHMTADTATLPFEQIIAHHNALLDGFDAGKHEIQVRPSSEILLMV